MVFHTSGVVDDDEGGLVDLRSLEVDVFLVRAHQLRQEGFIGGFGKPKRRSMRKAVNAAALPADLLSSSNRANTPSGLRPSIRSIHSCKPDQWS